MPTTVSKLPKKKAPPKRKIENNFLKYIMDDINLFKVGH